MNVVENAIWQVESNIRRAVTLEDVAASCGVTPSHLTRVFATATGTPLMRYARARRLSEAARILALGVPDILSLALDAGYGSHEAFTRAFREHFGTTPEAVRDARTTLQLELTEPMIMDTTPDLKLSEPAIEKCQPILLAGLVQLFAPDNIGAIPSLWEKFNTFHGQIPDVVGKGAYGASLAWDEEKGCEYMAAVEVSSADRLPREFETRKIPATTYAKFRQPGHITLIRATIGSIWNEWLPRSGHQIDEAAPLMEYYPPEFDPATGNGGFEVWVAVKG